MQMKTQVDRGMILYFMKQALAEKLSAPYSDYMQIMLLMLDKLRKSDLVEFQGSVNNALDNLPSTNSSLAILLTEAYQQLFTLGYLVPRPGQINSPLNPYHFAVTEMGRQWVTTSDAIPEDAQGYIRALRALVPKADNVILQYVEEAVLTYQRRTLFASAVMIGAANEKALYLVIGALTGAVANQQEKSAIQNLINIERSLPKMYKRLSDSIGRAKSLKIMDYPVHEDADRHLLSVQTAIRVQRNDAIHPQAGKVQLETVRLALSAFPAACKKIYDLMEWFTNNPNSL